MKSRVYKLYTDVYVVLDKITAFGDDGEGEYIVSTVDGEYYCASKEDIKMIAALLS